MALLAKFLSIPCEDFSWLSLPPEKHHSCRLFPLARSSSRAQGKRWESLEQAAPVVAESFPHPRCSPDPSRSVLLWLLLSRLLLCSCPAPQPEPCSHPRRLSFGTQTDLLTCEQILLKNRYPPFQRAKSRGQPGKTGTGHGLNLVLLCTRCGSSHEGRRTAWHELGLGDQKSVPLHVRNHFR